MAIKKLSAEELAAMHLTPLGKKHPVRAMIESLKVGEALKVGYQDFKWKGKSPTIFTKELERKRKGKFSVYKDGTMGWVVVRDK